MTDRSDKPSGYVGYGSPPTHTKFKPGNREYLKRKKKTKPDIADDMRSFLQEVLTYREGRKTKRGRRIDVHLLKLITSALKGDLAAAETLIDLRENATKFSDLTKTILEFEEMEAFI